MTRPTLETLSFALLTSLVCLAPIACDSSNSQADANPATSLATPAPQVESEPTPTVVEQGAEPKVEAKPALGTPVTEAPIVKDEPLLASTTTPSTIERRPRAADSMRSPSLLPADTPEDHVLAFTELPLSKRDKAPVGGVGATGIHLDELEVGKGWASSRCEDIGESFTVDIHERVNVCFRVVHPREAETVTLEWARDGKVRQSIDVNVKPTHAYLTRAWLPVTKGRVGDWTATVKSADGSVLGQIEFEIGE